MKRCFFNNDNNCFIYRQMKYDLKTDETSIRNYISQYKGSNITDFAINTFGQVQFFPSDVCEDELKLYKRMVETQDSYLPENTGLKWGKEFAMKWRELLCGLYEKGLDIVAIWIDELRKINVKPWATIRVNDCHNLFQSEWYFPKFRQDANGRYDLVRHRKPIDYYEKNFDFSFEEVRNRLLSVVKETLDKYDFDGIDMDFVRHNDCFSYGSEYFGREIMTEFMREVKKTVTAAEKKYGHKIEISVRCNPILEYNIELGLDIIRWAKEGLADIVVPSPKYMSSDINIPYYLWKEVLGAYNVQVFGAYDILMRTSANDLDNALTDINNAETVFGSAAAFLSQGVDGLYFFNYFDNIFDCKNGSLKNYLEKKDNNETSLKTPEGYFRLWFELTLDENVYKLPRRAIYTYNDKVPMWRTRYPLQNAASEDNGLPAELKPFDKHGTPHICFFRLVTGKIEKGSKVILWLGLSEPYSGKVVSLFLNSKPLKYIGKTECKQPKLTSNPLYAFEVENDGNMPAEQVIEIFVNNNKDKLSLDYIEVSVNKDFQ